MSCCHKEKINSGEKINSTEEINSGEKINSTEEINSGEKIKDDLDSLLSDLNTVLENISEDSDKINSRIFMDFYHRAFTIYANWEVYFFSKNIEPFVQKILEFLKDKNKKQKSITYKIFAYYWRIPEYLGIYKEDIYALKKTISIAN